MEYLVTKLVTGETLVALSGETFDDYISLVYPFEVVKETYPVEGGIMTKTELHPYLKFSEDQVLRLQVKHMVYAAPLKPDLVEVYKNMVDAFEAANHQDPYEEPSKDTFLIDPVDTLQ